MASLATNSVLSDGATSVPDSSIGPSTFPLSTAAPATKLIEQRRQLATVNEALAQTHMVLAAKDEELRRRGEAFRAKDDKFQAAMVRFHGFLRELENKTARANKRAATEATITTEKEREVDEASAHLRSLALETRALAEQSRQLQRYNDYLSDFCGKFRDEFGTSFTVADRYFGLLKSHCDLVNEQQELASRLEAAHEGLSTARQALARHAISSQLLHSSLRERLSKVHAASEELQAGTDAAVAARGARLCELNTLLATLQNMHARCGSSERCAVLKHGLCDAQPLETAQALVGQRERERAAREAAHLAGYEPGTGPGPLERRGSDSSSRRGNLQAPPVSPLQGTNGTRSGTTTAKRRNSTTALDASLSTRSGGDSGRLRRSSLSLAIGSSTSLLAHRGSVVGGDSRSPSHNRSAGNGGTSTSSKGNLGTDEEAELLASVTTALQQLHVISAYIIDFKAIADEYAAWVEEQRAQAEAVRVAAAAEARLLLQRSASSVTTVSNCNGAKISLEAQSSSLATPRKGIGTAVALHANSGSSRSSSSSLS